MRLCLISGLLLAAFSRGEIVDRIAVTLGNQVITQSELSREIRLTAFLMDEQPDFSPAQRRKAADRLIEQKLIRRELQLSGYPVPELAEVEPLWEKFRRDHSWTPEQFSRELEKAGITAADLRLHLLWQLSLLRFIEIRFRPGIQVAEEEIRQIFEQSQAGAAPADQRVSYEEARDRIEQSLMDQRVDKEMDNWLKETRARTRIEYHEEAFRS